MLRAALLTSSLLLVPNFAFAVGSNDSTPPTQTQTSSDCEGTQVWDEETETCVDAEKSSALTDDDRYNAVRELAYGGAYERVLGILDTFENDQDDRRLTYLGFVSRKMGDMDTGMSWYQAALDINPDNLLARSYMGQAYLIQGNAMAASEQLREIRARGGRETWAARSLELALRNGPEASY